MIPFKCAWVLNRQLLIRPIIISFIDSVLCEIGWRETKARWKRQMPIWDKIREHAKKNGVKGKIAVIKLDIK